nr:hypothetical protein [uncultured Desulfuromonas sp.]
MGEQWEFEAAVGCFRVIDTSLRCIYEGEAHMYRALSTQLRILLCDSNWGKDNSLLPRLFGNIELTPLKKIEFYQPGTFPEHLEYLNNVHAVGSSALEIGCMPFEVIRYFNGVEICQPMLDEGASPIPLTEWVDQLFTVHPVPLSLRDLIKVVADRDGGAHVHHKEDALLKRLQETCPANSSIGALVVIGLARVMQKVGWAVVSHFERHGATGKLNFDSSQFTNDHPLVQKSSQIPTDYYNYPQTRFNLLSVRSAES